MRIGYHLNKEDFVHFNYHALESLPSAPNTYRADRIATALVIPVSMTATATLIHYRLSTALITLAISSVFAVHLFVTFAKTHKLERLKKLRGTFEGADFSGLVGQHWLDLTDQGLVEYSEGQTLSVAWSGVKRVGFDGGRIYIYISQMQAVIVPLSAFQSAQEYSRFVESLRAWTRLPLTGLTADFSQALSY